MKKTSLLLSLNADVNTLDTPSGHQCSSSHYNLDEVDIEIFDNLETLENSLAIDTKMGLVHIAGYVTRNGPRYSRRRIIWCHYILLWKIWWIYWATCRGQLNIPTDCAVQWSFFSFIIFQCVKDSVCRSSLSKIFSRISEHHKFGMTSHHSRIL